MVLQAAPGDDDLPPPGPSTRFFIFAVPHALAAASLRMSTGEASRDDDATTSSSEITFDPPLGKFPPWSFQHPVLVGASARWRAGGGSAGLIALLKDGENIKAFRTLVRFTGLMVAVPLGVMGGCYALLPSAGVHRHTDRVLYAGIAAIVAVQAVVVAYLVLAFAETPPAQKKNQ